MIGNAGGLAGVKRATVALDLGHVLIAGPHVIPEHIPISTSVHTGKAVVVEEEEEEGYEHMRKHIGDMVSAPLVLKRLASSGRYEFH